jgi:hypothetical protein
MGFASSVVSPMVIHIQGLRPSFVCKSLIFISNTRQSSLKVILKDNILYTVDPLRRYAVMPLSRYAVTPFPFNADTPIRR